MTTDGFREIQLNGKQLVFLFMAATVVSVVIFLCGVLVGRGVRPERAAQTETAAAVVPDPAPAPAAQASAASTISGTSSSVQPPADAPAPADELSYFDRLQKNDTPKEVLKSSSSTPTVKSAPQRQAPETHPTAAPMGEPSGPGFAVQATTEPDRGSADALVKRLIQKGYPAYVTGPVNIGGRTIFRVRVGKYKSSKEAEAIKKRLEIEEQFKPWLVR